MPRPDVLASSPGRGPAGGAGPGLADRLRPAVPGILTAREVLATGEHIAAMQEPSGALSWPDGHTDAWDHVECAMALSACGLTSAARLAYDWLRHTQRTDGSWPKRVVGDTVTDAGGESNQTAYVAVGTWHEFQLTGDEEFLALMWPTVRRAIGFVLSLQVPRGEILWQRAADGTAASYALLTGCASTYQSLCCAVWLAEYLGQPQPAWELAAGRLGHVVACHPEAFADKSWFSMDWYYPVLAGPVRGPAGLDRLDAQWAEFVVPGLGVRCVRGQPWITGAETCELVMALHAVGDHARARQVYADVQHLRDADGGYWTGWQFANQEYFPAERSSWTAAAMVLAADVLSGTTGAAAMFRDVPLPPPAEPGSPRHCYSPRCRPARDPR
ncbi:MAG TPA: prenyltransferase [Streptosporangiaceae bacterium]|nr:prenyltransferase [Streptosporangiaceae bacterium]